MKLRLLGLIDIKDVSVQVVDRRVVSLCGTPFGIKMVTDGVMVVGTGSVTNLQSQAVNPAEDAGINIRLDGIRNDQIRFFLSKKTQIINE